MTKKPPTTLCEALCDFDAEAAKKFLEQGSDPNERDPASGETALHLAIVCDDFNDALWRLRTLNPNDPDGTCQMMKLLLAKGADIDAVDNEGETPLIMAVRFKRKRAIYLLVAKGASLDIKNKKGWTAFDWANYHADTYNHTERKEWLVDALKQRDQTIAREVEQKRIDALRSTAATKQNALKQHRRKIFPRPE